MESKDPGRKSIASLIVKSRFPKNGDPLIPEEDDEDEEMEAGLDQAAEDMMAAVDTRDAVAFKEALRAFLDII